MRGQSFDIGQNVRTLNKVINIPVKQLKMKQLIKSKLCQEHEKGHKTKGKQRKQGEHKRVVFITSSLSYIKSTKFICLEAVLSSPFTTSVIYPLTLGFTNSTEGGCLTYLRQMDKHPKATSVLLSFLALSVDHSQCSVLLADTLCSLISKLGNITKLYNIV